MVAPSMFLKKQAPLPFFPTITVKDIQVSPQDSRGNNSENPEITAARFGSRERTKGSRAGWHWQQL